MTFEQNALSRREACALTSSPARDRRLFTSWSRGRRPAVRQSSAAGGRHGDDRAGPRTVSCPAKCPLRGACFVCAAVAVHSDGREAVEIGELRGADHQAARVTTGFGYDPIFEAGVPVSRVRTPLLELSADASTRVSHRGRAFWQLVSGIPCQVAGATKSPHYHQPVQQDSGGASAGRLLPALARRGSRTRSPRTRRSSHRSRSCTDTAQEQNQAPSSNGCRRSPRPGQQHRPDRRKVVQRVWHGPTHRRQRAVTDHGSVRAGRCRDVGRGAAGTVRASRAEGVGILPSVGRCTRQPRLHQICTDMRQSGLGLPDRDYYLEENFAQVRPISSMSVRCCSGRGDR